MGNRAVALVLALTAIVGGAHAEAQVAFEVLHSFSLPLGAVRLMQASDGTFWVTTQRGGASDRGAIVKVGANGTITPLFVDGPGTHFEAPLIQGSDGNLWGTTSNFSGSFDGNPGTAGPIADGFGKGTVFTVDPSTEKVTFFFTFFSGQPAGAHPRNP